jgi:hypothetical protein
VNADRRKRLAAAIDELRAIRDEEEEAYEALPESFQEGEQGRVLCESIDNIDEAIEALDQL